MNNGGVRIGFSEPYVAIYSHNGNDISYANGQKMARGVSVNMASGSNNSSKFFADNVEAESAAGKFTGGTLALGVDGLTLEADKLMRGLPAATSLTVGTETVQVYVDNDEAETPYVGVGYIEKWQFEGVQSYRPVVIYKCKLATPDEGVQTETETENWQTQNLTFDVVRSDKAKRDWRLRGEHQETEAAALAVIKQVLNITGD